MGDCRFTKRERLPVNGSWTGTLDETLSQSGKGGMARNRADEEARRQAAKHEASQPTVREAINSLMAKHIEGKTSAPAIRYRLDRLAEKLGDRKIRSVVRKDVLDALEEVAEGRREGRTAKQLAGEILVQAKRLWRFAETHEWVPTSCIESLKRADLDARPRKRDVKLQIDEAIELWRALGDPRRCTADAITIAALRLIMLTGQREREVTDAEWSEFDLDKGVWKIPAIRTKTRKAHVVHLAPQAIKLLEAIKSKTGHRRHVFASPRCSEQPIYGRSVNNALAAMFKRGVLPKVTPCHVHDLRRTLITRLPDLGFEAFVGHKIANHVLPSVLGIYNLGEYLGDREEALNAWARRIDEPDSEVEAAQVNGPPA